MSIEVIEDREYQNKLIRSSAIEVKKHFSVIVCSATGSGKTITFLKIAERALAAGKTVLIISEAKKIFEQISEQVTAIEINDKVKAAYVIENRLYLAMTQTLANRAKMIEDFVKLGSNLLIIADEAHIGTHTKLLLQFKEHALILGFTATPDYRFAKHLPKIYNGFVMGPQPHELVISGHLSSYRHFMRKVADLSGLQTKSTGDFTEESQEIAFGSVRVYDGLMEDLKKFPFKKCVIFTASIKQCREVHQQLTEAGFEAIQVHNKTDKKTDAIEMARFKKGNINICVSVAMVTKGWDFKPIDLVILLRATKSLPLYLQMIGRGSRVYVGTGTKDNPEKKWFTVLDYGLNAERHGPWDVDRPWDEMWQEPKKKKRLGVPPIKICPTCEFILSPSVMICPNCGHVFIKYVEREVETVLVEVTSKYSAMIGKKLSELTPVELAEYALMKGNKHLCQRVAMAGEQKNPGFLKEYGSEMGYKFGWVTNTYSRMPADGSPVEFKDYTLR